MARQRDGAGPPRPRGLPQARGSAPGPPSRSSSPGRSSGSPATRCSWRSASTTGPASAPRPPCCSRSTSPPRCRPRRPTSASSRRPASRCCRPTASSHTDALAYGIILQAVEIATALAMGMPALVREGMTWKDLRAAGDAHVAGRAGAASAAIPPRPRPSERRSRPLRRRRRAPGLREEVNVHSTAL